MKTTDLTQIKKYPFDYTYTFGKVVKIHEISNFSIVEYVDRHSKSTLFQIYVDGKSVGVSSDNLDSALAIAIARKYERDPSSQAAYYFCKMIGIS